MSSGHVFFDTLTVFSILAKRCVSSDVIRDCGGKHAGISETATELQSYSLSELLTALLPSSTVSHSDIARGKTQASGRKNGRIFQNRDKLIRTAPFMVIRTIINL